MAFACLAETTINQFANAARKLVVRWAACCSVEEILGRLGAGREEPCRKVRRSCGGGELIGAPAARLVLLLPGGGEMEGGFEGFGFDCKNNGKHWWLGLTGGKAFFESKRVGFPWITGICFGVKSLRLKSIK